VFVLLFGAGCSLTPLEEDQLEPAQNTCSGDSDCPGGVCNQSLGVCASTEGAFPNVLLEVTPPSSLPGYGGIGFLKNVQGLPLSGGNFDVDVNVVAKVTGSVSPTKGNYSNCVLGYGQDQDRSTAPVKVTFTSSAKILGLSAPQYVTTSEWDSASETYQFEAWMPADSYDVYVEPYVDPNEENPFPDTSCAVAPQFAYASDGVQWEVPAGDFTLPLVLQAPSLLSVKMPAPVDLTGWLVEVIHPENGKLLSAPTTLTSEFDGVYVADVEYTQLSGPEQLGKELVRIRPIPCSDPIAVAPYCDQIGPTLVVERKAVELANGEAVVDQLAKLKPSETEQFPWITLNDASLFGSDGYYQGSATVRFVSSALDLEDETGGQLQGVLAFFERTVETKDGKLEPIQLLPGSYTVFVAPTTTSDYATTTAELSIARTPEHQSGKTITLDKVSEVDGVVLTAAMEPAVGATVQAAASPFLAKPVEIAAGSKPFQPQALSGTVDETGQFLLQADPGTLDFSVRPADGTAFPWLVRPNVEVQSGPKQLGEMQVPWPVIYQGAIILPEKVGASGALIRAYVYLNQDGYAESREGATSVLQIAETRADANGNFRLFLPPHLN
jgi:hypothetical protein